MIMTYKILYLIAAMGWIVIGTLLAIAGWLLYKHLWYEFVDWLDEASDRALLWVVDRLLGEHETRGFK